MIHRVRRRKCCYRRQHPECVAGKKDHISGVAGDTRNFCVLDELDRVSAARVLGNADVGVIDHPIDIEDEILQHRAKKQCLENVRLAFRGEIDRLGVAAAFDVEDSVVGPNVFVIADKMSFRIGRKRCLTGPTESKKERRRAGLLFGRG